MFAIHPRIEIVMRTLLIVALLFGVLTPSGVAAQEPEPATPTTTPEVTETPSVEPTQTPVT